MKVNVRKAAEAIGLFQDVATHGALRAENVEGLQQWNAGRLSGDDYEQFVKDCGKIRYVVYSYATPIAWVAHGKVYKVKQKFSITTTKHQGQLYKLSEVAA